MDVILRVGGLLVAAALTIGTAAAAQAPDAARAAAQKQAIAVLSAMDGEWSGPMTMRGPAGETRMTQTERVGLLLDGAVRLVEGRSYDAAGATAFNALGVMSYDVDRKAYVWQAHSGGRAVTVDLQVTPESFSWTLPAGPSGRIEYAAAIKGGTWTETGDYVGADGVKRRVFEMTLTRRGDSAWPAGVPVPPKG